MYRYMMEQHKVHSKRLSFQEALELIPVDARSEAPQPQSKRFISRQPAWTPGQELPWHLAPKGVDKLLARKAAFGGVVYALAPLAAARAIHEEDHGAIAKGLLGIHSIQGVFTNPGLNDRPFVLDVGNVISNRSFATRLVNVRQPKVESSAPSGPFPVTDAQSPLGDICFTCLTTFKRPLAGPSDAQETHPPQERYKQSLGSRDPLEWPCSPQMDVDAAKLLFGDIGHVSFPILDMHKVDMTEFNDELPVPERRELIYYRPMEPIPEDDPNAHIVCHAFGADRNGLIMLGNHLGYGFNLGKAASLSYSFYVHVNADEAVMTGDGWWIQEVSWPRTSAGRGMMEVKIWSPEGKHVASGYQDGVILPSNAPRKQFGGKL